ncbi:MAG: DNA phosphorothioation-associated putative methyltransferase [Chroococcales cyanobacterium]
MSLNLEQLAELCQQSQVGKLLPSAFYVHLFALNALNPELQDYEKQARQGNLPLNSATLVKFSTDKPKISYLFYPDFDTNPHPALQASVQVNLNTLQVTYRDYRTSENPPILHRKETFVTPEYPLYEAFEQLTRLEVSLGLLDNARFIGTRQEWLYKLQAYGIELQGHTLIQHPDRVSSALVSRIERHRAAIVRKELSRPVRSALEADLFTPETTFFDYGCGYGGDIKRIAEKGFVSAGWDPYYSPNTPITNADIVNLGYVINVIEDIEERRETLLQAWKLARKVLIVAAQVLISDRMNGLVAYGDGVITRRNTFQKYYEQEELKQYIDSVLNVDAIPVGIGVFLVFRDSAEAESFRASRFYSRATTPRIRLVDKRFEDYEEILTPLMEFVTNRGRLPIKGELKQEAALLEEFSNFRRAFRVVLQVTNQEEWDAIADKRRQELLLYLALSQFSDRPKPKELAPQVKADIKALFGSYKSACILADQMLFTLGNSEIIAKLCAETPIGKKYSNSLYIHISALNSLPSLLRLYEGCASQTIGRLENVNVIKFSIRQPKITYLFYPDFDSEPHPLLRSKMQIDLRDLHVSYEEFDILDNPPILHCKEQLISPDYPLYDKFARLTRQEEDWGLLDDFKAISRHQGWLRCLEDHCTTLQGYRLSRCKDADPYKLKLLRSDVKYRQQKRRKVTSS